MKLLISAGIYPPDIGGPATYVRELQEKLPEEGIEVDVVVYSDSESGYDEQYDVYRINRNQSVLERYWDYFKQAFRLAKNADLIYVQGPGGPALPSYFASRLSRTPYIMKIVGDYAWEQSRQRFGVDDLLDEFQEKRYNWKVEFFRKLQSFVTKRAEKIITPSNYLKSIVEKWGVESSKISVVYNDVSVDTIDKTKREIKKELSYTDDEKFTLLCIARFVPWKGFYKLIDAVDDLNQEGENVQLLLIGDGTIYSEVKNYVDNNEIENVKLLGRRPHEEVLKYMKVVDAFILNTGYEGLPHVLIEAMYNKLPILTTPAGGNTELIEDKKRGLLFSYNEKKEIKEAIQKLSGDKNLRTKLAKNGYYFVKELEKEDMIENLLSELEEYESTQS
ncbi:MAG: glycosyltransferase family 4 protein [Candidatus Magasanikbacteria bacterium]